MGPNPGWWRVWTQESCRQGWAQAGLTHPEGILAQVPEFLPGWHLPAHSESPWVTIPSLPKSHIPKDQTPSAKFQPPEVFQGCSALEVPLPPWESESQLPTPAGIRLGFPSISLDFPRFPSISLDFPRFPSAAAAGGAAGRGSRILLFPTHHQSREWGSSNPAGKSMEGSRAGLHSLG